MQARGRCWKFRDNIPTDRIVQSDRVFGPMEEIVKHVLETCNPEPRRNSCLALLPGPAGLSAESP